MSSLDDFELQGAEKTEVLRRLHEQIAAWGLALPPVEALPLHFGLHRFTEIGETEFWIANETALGYCGKFLFVFDGQTCPYHHHRLKHETFFIVKGSVLMKVGEEERVMSAGDLLAMPPGTGHSFTGRGPALILEVSMPSIRQDSFFFDENIGDNGVI
jgi:mannose-6-phosphate isomerase-like protein (cupin superfamily)